jgi:hypothetical protein
MSFFGIIIACYNYYKNPLDLSVWGKGLGLYLQSANPYQLHPKFILKKIFFSYNIDQNPNPEKVEKKLNIIFSTCNNDFSYI